MASSDDGSEAATAADQCIALTAGGERCGRRANDGRFCYQHGEDDPTIDDEDDENDEAGGDGESDGESRDESGESDEPGESGDTEDADDVDDAADESDESTDGSTGDSSVMAVRGSVVEVSSDLIGRPLDGVVEVGKTEDGWRAVVEVIERRAVPDTQDILGRYELMLDDDETVTGYRRVGRSRRADTDTRE